MKNNLTHFARLLLLSITLFIVFPAFIFPISLDIRSYDHPSYTRIVFQSNQSFQFNYRKAETTLEIKLQQKAELTENTIPIQNSKLVESITHSVERNQSILNVRFRSRYKLQKQFVLESPFRVVFDLVADSASGESVSKPVPPAVPPQTSPMPESPESTVSHPNAKLHPNEKSNHLNNADNKTLIPGASTPQTGAAQTEPESTQPKKREIIERICIDAGHGGSDLGAVGVSGGQEKDITLKIARLLRRQIQAKLGLQVIMTRDDDSEVSLNYRAAQANNQKSQLFVSIHVNSSYRKQAHGSETYFVSLKATDQEALSLSQKENSSVEEIEQMTQDDELKLILWDMAQNEYIKESSLLAEYIQNELNILLQTANRGVKQAPFRVLMRAGMPAVLVEVAFLSNPSEEKRLQDDTFLEHVADAIYQGISKYIYYHNNLFQ